MKVTVELTEEELKTIVIKWIEEEATLNFEGDDPVVEFQLTATQGVICKVTLREPNPLLGGPYR